ncbi:hypothetical protein ACLKA7_014866 [Drosophila subpalustris]
MKAEYTLYKSNELADAETNDTFAFLEIEVSRINFITDKSIKAQTSASLYEGPGQPKASSSLSQHQSARASGVGVVGAVTAKIIWWGEKCETAAGVSISWDACISRSDSIKKLYVSSRQQQQQQSKKRQHKNRHQHHNKFRYCVRSKSLALFLDYLRECPSIDIVASRSTKSKNDHAYDQQSTPTAASASGGAARLPLPAPLQRKYAAKNVNGCNFEYKTEIYALYRHVKISGTSGQVQQQQQLKVGEIQLCFKMLFAAAAASANKTVRIGAATVPPPLPLPPPTSLPAALLQDHQLTINNNCSQSQPGERISGTVKSIGSAVAAPAKVELMEAMKKLDADLVALFATAGEPAMEQLKKQQQHQQLWPEQELSEQELALAANGEIDQATPELFKLVNALQLHLEALTLQAEGTKRMELLQSEVRPIFTVECQLSEELINAVPRASMFHIMQFESEKFQSLTQCTRFGQTQQREVRLPKLDLDQEMGSIHFTIWWREPGTCLNEMLGMGRLNLAELYQASLLEQCKCIAIQRRDVHLASLYLKISLRADQQLMLSKVLANETNNNNGSSSNNNSYHSAAAAANNKNNNSNSNESNNSKAASTPSATLTPPSKNNSNNNKASLESVNFMAETTKVRLLRGYIYASETRHLSPADADGCKELVLQPFWQPQPLSVQVNPQGDFQLQEQFAIINDEKFLHSVERQHLVLELRPLGGQVKLPLHQFYIAYKDASITNHLCKGKLPVISIDGWTPIVHPETQAQLGELKVLLAIGSESQIAQLKQLRGFDSDNNQQPLRRTTDLLDMLQNALSAPATTVPTPSSAAILTASSPTGSQFSFSLHIVGAAGLPLNPGYGKSGKKQAKRQAAAKRFPPNEPPNTYVTFQALSCNAQTYKSHEGLVYATPIMERSTTPQWHSKFEVAVAADYLSNPQKLFVLKLWKKTALSAGTSTEPTPLEDAIIGFAALNLNRNRSGGFPSGWHNIVDFNGRVTGGLDIHVQPLPGGATSSGSVDSAIDQFEQSLELRHLQLGQAIKRKFTELEQISNRLRTRLVDVTGESLQSPQFDVDAALDNWQPDEMQQCHEDDELVADFERALRTPTPPPPPPADASDVAAAKPTAQSPPPADAGNE